MANEMNSLIFIIFNDFKSTPLYIWESQNMELFEKPVQSTQVPLNRGFSIKIAKLKIKITKL